MDALERGVFWYRSRQNPAISQLMLQPLVRVPWLSLDLELTGLGKKDDIVSFGWVEGSQLSLDFASCHHALVQPQQALAQSPLIHGITQEQLSECDSIKIQLQLLASFFASHVVICHCHPVDWQALKRNFRQQDIAIKPFLVLDTLLLERYCRQKNDNVDADKPFTLAACRQRYGLPPAAEHNALDDACATLELFYAQLASLLPWNAKLADLKHTGALLVLG